MQKAQTTCLAILTTIAIGFSLYFLQSVLLPFVIAIFIVIGCRPILNYVETRLKLPRFLAFGFSFLFGILLLLVFAFLTWVSVNDLAQNSQAYEKRMNVIVTWIVEHVPNKDRPSEPTVTVPPTSEPPSELQSEPTLQEGETTDPAEAIPNQGELTAAKNPTQAIQDFLKSVSTFIQSQLVSLAGSLSALLSYGVLILIFVFFLLLGHGEPDKSTVDQNERTGILAKIEEQIRKYLLMKTIISLITGFVFGSILWLFGVPLAIVFGFLAFLLNFIPNIGPLIATVLPVPFLMLNAEMSPTSAIICFALISTTQFVSGNVIETRLMGQSFDVSPIALLLALMFFGLVWGIVGMFLATPIVSIIKIVLQQHQSTRPLAQLMAGHVEVIDSIRTS